MEDLLLRSKCSIFHNIVKYMIFQRRQKALYIYEGVDRGGGGTGVEGAESGVEGAESGVEGAGSGGRGGGERG